VIEAGFAAASKGETDAISAIARERLTAELCSMARAVQKDVDAALKCDVDSVHIVVPSSDLHLKFKLKKSKEDVLKAAEACIQHAKDHGLAVELSAEDATRADIAFVKQLFSVGASLKVDRICPCDTVGVLTPQRSYSFFDSLRRSFHVPLSVHCHDDFGLAVANSVAALQAGAKQVHVTVNGLGERAGNAALEEVAMVLKSLYEQPLSIKTELIYETSRLVSKLTGLYVQPNKAIVGENAFLHESGIHTHGILANPLTYEPIDPRMVGVTRRFGVGKLAGSHGIQAVLKQMGLEPSESQLMEIFQRVKTLGDQGKRVTDADLLVIAEAVMRLPETKPIHLEKLVVFTGDNLIPTASVTISLDGQKVTEASTGDGPVDAAMNAVRKAVTAIEPITLEEYSVKAVTGGTDAVVEVAVRLRKGDRAVTATGARGDIVMASVEAMLSGINVLLVEENNAHKHKKQVRSDG